LHENYTTHAHGSRSAREDGVDETILYDAIDPVATITLNRP
jgi:hypothetical protein